MGVEGREFYPVGLCADTVTASPLPPSCAPIRPVVRRLAVRNGTYRRTKMMRGGAGCLHCFVPPRAAVLVPSVSLSRHRSTVLTSAARTIALPAFHHCPPGPSASHYRHRALSWRQRPGLSRYRSSATGLAYPPPPSPRQSGLSAGEGRQYLHADRAVGPILAQHTAFLGAPAIND